MKHKKRALFQSVVALILCLSMFAGTTFAWFTDSVSSGSNIIAAGNLDIQMQYTDDLTNGESWKDASEGAIFNYQNWEPGYTDLKYLKIENLGNLAFQYQLSILPADGTPGGTSDPNENGNNPEPPVTSETPDSNGDDGSDGSNNPSRQDGTNPVAAVSGDSTASVDGGSIDGGSIVGGSIDGGSIDSGSIDDSTGTTIDGGEITLTGAAKLAEVIDVYYGVVNSKFATREEAVNGLKKVGTLSQLMNQGVAQGILLPAEGKASTNAALPEGVTAPSGETTACIMLKMQETAGNEYMNLSVGNGFSVKVLATQYAYEKDTFGSDFDAGAVVDIFPVFNGSIGGSADVETGDDGKTTTEVTIGGEEGGAKVPVGVQVTEGTTELTLSVIEKSESDANISLGANDALRSLDVHIEGVADNNTVPIIVNLGKVLPMGMNIGNVKLYHVENDQTSSMTRVDALSELDAHNEFYYDPATGDVTVAMATFSEVALVANSTKAWEGKADFTWYTDKSSPYTIANADQLYAFAQIVGGMNGQKQDSFSGKTVKLISDINLNATEGDDKIFYPIGYYNSTNTYERTKDSITSDVHPFEGTFDGTGHTIANFYQNTWEMFGDYNSGYEGTPNYYKDAMGLFGYIKGGTVKNLTVDNFKSDGEFTPTGVIAAFADGDASFENIAITNCNPRVYNTGNGGIIGIAGSTSAANDDHITLKNITVDNSNIISALWGSWDVACGGLVGMYRGNVDGSGNATDDTINFTNCHVAAQIDVYNDVCANYQYYAYRYAGMIIGSVRHNTTNADGKTIPNMTGITASGCTVNYGDWNDYYYCEFEENTMASYSEDYQFSRVPNSEIDTTNGKENATCIGHDHTEAEDKQAVYLPFHQLFTGYSWGVSSIGLKEYGGIAISGDIDIEEGEQEESVEKFETKFTGDFLYRVGNQNAVSVGSLFAAKEGATINSSGVAVSITSKHDDGIDMGTFTPNTDDWTKGTIQFSGTGVVKVTIQDYDFCTPTELYLEVVDAENLTSATGYTGDTSKAFVLLCDVNSTNYVNYWNCSLYGNGFTYSLNGAPTAYNSKQGHGILITKNATLDNLVIVGDIYDEYGAYTTNNDYNAAIDVLGETVIQNCYISGCSAPVSTRANATIKNTTLYGGAVGNLIIKGGTVTLENVTTVNYDDGRDLVGMGIVIHSDASEASKLVLNGTLTQKNFIKKSDTPSDTYAKNLHNAMFDSSCSLYHFSDGSDTYVNTGIISLTTKFDNTDITDNAKTGYVGQSVSASGFEGYVYTQPNTSGSVNNNYDKNTDSNVGTAQGAVPPSYKFDYTTKNYVAKVDGSNNYCYEENGIVKISMDDGDTFNWDTSILTVTKGEQTLDYTVSMNGTDYTGKSITFDTAGDYEVVYTYTDPNNFKKNESGDLVSYSETYTKTVKISVAVIKATTKHATFTMGSSNEATEKITINNATYISATGVTADNSTWTCITIDGQKIYYPIVAAKLTSTEGSSTYAYFPVFENVVTITDYADNGTGDAFTYNSSTTAASHTLLPTAVKGAYMEASKVTNWYDLADGSLNQSGASKIFKWASSSDAPSDATTYNNVLCYMSPEISADRVAYITLVQYSYTDATNTTYYYYVGYTLEAFKKECVTADTLITLANGSQVRADALTGKEELLVWNLETGKLDSAPIMFVDSDPEAEFEIVHLYFSDGTDVKVISEHGFWDYDLNKYVYLDANADDYIGHTFAKQNGNELTKVQLTDVVIETEVTTAWSPVTEGHLCYFVNGMLSMPGGVGGLFNIFDVNPETMTYDMEAMARDIETYGLYTYEELNSIAPLSEDMFNAAGGAYMKISIGKGNLTMDELVAMINRYSKFFE